MMSNKTVNSVLRFIHVGVQLMLNRWIRGFPGQPDIWGRFTQQSEHFSNSHWEQNTKNLKSIFRKLRYTCNQPGKTLLSQTQHVKLNGWQCWKYQFSEMQQFIQISCHINTIITFCLVLPRAPAHFYFVLKLTKHWTVYFTTYLHSQHRSTRQVKEAQGGVFIHHTFINSAWKSGSEKIRPCFIRN